MKVSLGLNQGVGWELGRPQHSVPHHAGVFACGTWPPFIIDCHGKHKNILLMYQDDLVTLQWLHGCESLRKTEIH